MNENCVLAVEDPENEACFDRDELDVLAVFGDFADCRDQFLGRRLCYLGVWTA